MSTARTHRLTLARRGTTLLETMICVVLFAFLMLAIYWVLQGSWGLYQGGVTHSELQELGRKAMARILGDVREAGQIDNWPDEDYPYIFTDGNATGAFADHAHAPALHAEAGPGRFGYGPSGEIVFKQAEDVDGDGYPTDAATGEIEWSDDEISYVLVTGAHGVNELQRRVNAGSAALIARHVERVTFDSYLTDPAVGFNQIRIRLHLRRQTASGKTVRAFLTATATMRNTQ